MSEVEHYFENLIHFGKDIEGNDNKDFLSKEVQEAVEECALYIRSLLGLGILAYTDVKPAWIPVSERLPEAGEYIGNVAKYYLVQNEYGDMMVARYTHSEYWEQIYQLNPIGDKIVAWMPLPQPYNAESEDK